MVNSNDIRKGGGESLEEKTKQEPEKEKGGTEDENGENGGADVAGGDQAGTGGELGSRGDGSGGERVAPGARGAEPGGRAGAEVGDQKPTLLDAVRDLYTKGKEYASKIYQMKFFEVADTPAFMKTLGLTGDKFTIRYGVIARHLGKDGSHGISEKEWEKLPEAIQRPFAITRLGDKEKGYRIYTTLKNGKGEYIVVGVDVKNAGREIEVNAISTVFGRRENAGQTLKEDLVYTDKEITPEQQALLNGPNFRQYPAEQESLESKQPGEAKSSDFELTEDDLRGIGAESGIDESIIDGARDWMEGDRGAWAEMCYKNSKRTC